MLLRTAAQNPSRPKLKVEGPRPKELTGKFPVNVGTKKRGKRGQTESGDRRLECTLRVYSTGRSPIYRLHLKEIHNLNVTSDLAPHN
jgi:hypothetical protein